MSLHPISSLILLSAVALSASAAEFDIRLTAGTAAVIDDVEISGSGTQDLEEEVSGSGSLTAHAFFGDGLIGFMVGGGFKAAVHAGDQASTGLLGNGQVDVTYESKSLLLEAGLTIRPLQWWRIELRPQLALGQGKVEADTSGSNAEGESGDYVSVGFVVGNFVRFDWFEIGVDLGYESMTGDSRVQGTDTTSNGAGIIAQLGVGVLF